MKLPPKANRRNIRLHARQLLGNNHTPELEKALIKECVSGFVRSTTPGGRPFGHISHDHRAHLQRIDKILGTCGVEGMLLDGQGEDLASQCTEEGVELDCQYCNTGDTYGLTLMYVDRELRIGDWGSLVEQLG